MASKGEKEVLVPSESSIKGIVEAQRILDTIKTSDDKSQNDKNLKSVLSFLKSKNAKINWDGDNIGISVSSGDEGDYNNIKTTLNVLLQMEKIKINPDTSEIALIQPPLAENPTQTASVELTTTLTSVELTKLKADIEAGKLTKELFLEVIRALGDKEKVKPEQKPFILSLLFSELNKKGINVGFSGDKTNKDWKISLSTKKIEISEDTSNFESILNEYLGTSFTRQDVLKSLLFKTETVDEYLKDAPDKKDIRKYAVFLCEKYNVAGGLKYENTGIKTSHMPEYEKSSLYNMRFENEAVFNAFIVEIKTKVLNVADRDFLIAYYNDLYYNEGKNNSGALEKYSSDIGKVSVQMVQGFANLSDSQKRELLGTENLAEKIDRAKKDPIGFVKETINNGGIASLLWGFLLGGIIGSISGIGFFKGGLGGALLGFGFSAFGMDGITEMAQKASMGVKEWLSKLPKDTSGLRDKYLHILTNNNIPGNLDKEKLTKTYALLLNNEKFRSSKATNLDVFLDSGSNYKKAFDYFKSIGIDLKNEDIPYYEYVFSELKKQREADGVGSYTSDESMETYLKRTSKVETDSASTASTAVAAGTASGSASVSAPGNTPSGQIQHPVGLSEQKPVTNIDIKEIEKNIDSKFNEFKVKINEIENNQTFYGGNSKEQKEKNAKELAGIYTSLMENILSIENNDKLSNSQKDKINSIKLYLAKYYGGKGEIENNHNKNYIKSVGLALQLLPNEAKTPFPTDIELAQKIKGQTGIVDYISKEVIKGRDPNEVMMDKEVYGKIIDFRGKLIEEYEEKLENYLIGLNLNKDKLSDIQKQSLDFIMDIQGVGKFDVKESNFDTATNLGGTLLSVGAGALTFAGGISLIPGYGWVVGGVSAVAGGIVTTAGIMVSNGDNYFVDRDDGLKEIALNSILFGVGGLVFKGARAIQGGNALFTSGRGLAALGIEVAGDIGIGASNDVLRGYFAGIGVSWSDALQNNLLWGLMPIGISGAGKVLGKTGKTISYSPSRVNLAEDIVKQAKGAEFLNAMGNPTGARKIWENLLDKINKTRAYSPESQNLLNPLKNNLDEIIALEDGKSLTAGEHKVTRVGDNYKFETQGVVTETIPKQVIQESARGSIVKSYVSEQIKHKLLKNGDTIDIGGKTITKVDKGFQISGNTTIYGNIDDILNDIDLIKPENWTKYGNETIDLSLKSRISEYKFKLNGEDYFYDKTAGTFKKKTGNNYVDVPPSFVQDNFAFLFKNVNGFDFKEGFSAFKGSVGKMKIKDYLQKVGALGELKSAKPSILNSTMSDLFSMPRIASQLSSLDFSSGKAWGSSKDLMKIIAFGDKNKTIMQGIMRLLTVGGAVTLDTLVGDSGDSEITDALIFMYGGIIPGLIGTYIFDDR